MLYDVRDEGAIHRRREQREQSAAVSDVRALTAAKSSTGLIRQSGIELSKEYMQ